MKNIKKFRKLSRTSAHRVAMLRTMVTQLITHERIKTTLPKAKELKRVADKMVTHAKEGNLTHRRLAAAYVRTDDAVQKLFSELGPRYVSREGGYTRVLRAGFRSGDRAPMAIIEYVDRPGELRPAREVSEAPEDLVASIKAEQAFKK